MVNLSSKTGMIDAGVAADGEASLFILHETASDLRVMDIEEE